MGTLTLEERRRVFLARQRKIRDDAAQLSAPVASPPHRLRGPQRAAVKGAMIAALLGVGWYAYHAVEIHIPASIAEALVPRL
jgi:hypothetical protein